MSRPSKAKRKRVVAEIRLARAILALDRIEDAARQPRGRRLQIILELAADALAELRDPATGKPWGLK